MENRVLIAVPTYQEQNSGCYDPPVNMVEYVQWMKELLESIPEQYRDGAKWNPFSYGTYYRDKNPEELQEEDDAHKKYLKSEVRRYELNLKEAKRELEEYEQS